MGNSVNRPVYPSLYSHFRTMRKTSDQGEVPKGYMMVMAWGKKADIPEGWSEVTSLDFAVMSHEYKIDHPLGRKMVESLLMQVLEMESA